MYAHSKQKWNSFKQDKCVGNFLKVQKDTDQAGYVFSLQYCYLYIPHESLKKEIYWLIKWVVFTGLYFRWNLIMKNINGVWLSKWYDNKKTN